MPPSSAGKLAKPRPQIFSSAANGRQMALFLALITVLLNGCHGDSRVETGIKGEYKPPFVPVQISVSTNGSLSLDLTQSIVTPIGTFSIAENVSVNRPPVLSTVLLVIRHKVKSAIIDEAFQVDAEDITVVLDGETNLRVSNKRIFVDASKGTVRKIEVKSGEVPREGSQGKTFDATLPLVDPLTLSNHASGWHADQYCRFASDGYHRSTIPVNYAGAGCANGTVVIGNADISVDVTLIARTPDSEQSSRSFDTGIGVVVRANNPISLAVREDGTWLVNPPERARSGFDTSTSSHSGGLEGSGQGFIKKGAGVSNRLRIVLVEFHAEFFVNGVRLGEVDLSNSNDPRGRNNTIRLHAHGYSHAVFTNLVVKPI